MIAIPDPRQLATTKIVVVGDIMLDSYWEGNINRVSPEAPVMVVNVGDEYNRLGGAGNVALNIAAWGVQTSLVGICGQDREGRIIGDLLKKSPVKDQLVVSAEVPTTRKLRIVSGQQLLRLDFEKDNQVAAPLVTRKVIRQLHSAGVLVISDYAKGALFEVEEIIRQACLKKIFILVDPKRSDFSCYKGASILTPNYAEFSRAVGGCHDHEDMLQKAKQMLKQLELQALLITCGADGMFLILSDRVYNIPAYSREVYDITGAGDTVIATLAAAIGSGMKLLDATELCSFAAGISVSKQGTGVIGYDEVVQHIKPSYITKRDLLKEIEQARTKGQKIVFTNGVFDVLHSGHVFYLEQAARLGDKLVVGINSDASVRRLKGDSRPINQLVARAMVLRSLKMVDWVVTFDEPTPKSLITAIKPDVLVKGGDYKSKADVVGSDIVESYGGSVRLMGYLDGQSTTDILNKGYKNPHGSS